MVGLQITWLEADPENHLERNWARKVIVEILSDFDKDDGFLFSHTVKVERFVSLFFRKQVAHDLLNIGSRLGLKQKKKHAREDKTLDYPLLQTSKTLRPQTE
ncbi:hypothetical protein L1987_14292 [Smallanthus sonchifolius]|uniref:Uncharacterized protein n=1 Tax=Smallanthus sonchifolius TaxID=185202 RepID=A0ACB9J2W8_9ASTR|nr:hypothetical protein L1987_14292 [Smallanthus sonchifolius]